MLRKNRQTDRETNSWKNRTPPKVTEVRQYRKYTAVQLNRHLLISRSEIVHAGRRERQNVAAWTVAKSTDPSLIRHGAGRRTTGPESLSRPQARSTNWTRNSAA